MANLPQSLFGSDPPSSSSTGASVPSTSGANSSTTDHEDPSRVYVEKLIVALRDENTRECALDLLNKTRATREDLALLLWHSSETIYKLLEEILAVYRLISKPNLTERQSNRTCNALALLQCVASHPETRKLFIKAYIPHYLYPLLNIMNKEKPYEHLRLTSLGVLGAIVKSGDEDAILFLLESQIFPCCLRCMEVGQELSKTVATYIVHNILMKDEGLKYCCAFAQRFYAVDHALQNMLENLAEEPSHQLLRHIIGCYLRLSQSPRACDVLRYSLPTRLRDPTTVNLLRDDPTAMGWLQQLFYNMSNTGQYTTVPTGELFARLLGGYKAG
ncbi:cell differentiation protein rcd1-like [Corylus avellana]|uniref:cell differentiation protein rcd1-like n=1 Tax=Corylus avellana TaxID=13451 RepID=UPI002869F574|nr:cell differentiation protein rcd1-like [Corylus avellana]